MTEVNSTRGRPADGAATVGAAYQEYAAGLFDYCLWASGDGDRAEDAVHAALIAALGRPGQLRDTRTLRGWLYAAARKELLKTGGPAAAEEAAPGRLGKVRAAAATLPSEDQHVAELAFRHRLVPDEVAAVLGQSMRETRAAIMRVHAALVAKYGPEPLVAYASPLRSAPDALYGRILASAAIPERVAYFRDRLGPYTKAGYPAPQNRRESRRGLVAVVALSTIALIGLATVLSQDQARPRVGLVVLPEPSVVLSVEDPLTPSPDASTPTATPTPKATPSRKRPSPTPGGRAPSPSAPPAQPAPPPPPAPTPTVQVSARSSGCSRSGTVTMTVTVTASGAPTNAASVSLRITSNQGQQVRSQAAQSTGGNSYTAIFSSVTSNAIVRVDGTATSTAGKTGSDSSSVLVGQCRR